jgi:hypothetical protein
MYQVGTMSIAGIRRERLFAGGCGTIYITLDLDKPH